MDKVLVRYFLTGVEFTVDVSYAHLIITHAYAWNYGVKHIQELHQCVTAAAADAVSRPTSETADSHFTLLFRASEHSVQHV